MPQDGRETVSFPTARSSARPQSDTTQHLVFDPTGSDIHGESDRIRARLAGDPRGYVPPMVEGVVPGLIYLPDWLDHIDQPALLANIDAAHWSTELRRRVQHYGHKYD